MQAQGLFDKNYFNILRARNIRLGKKKVGADTKQDDKTMKDPAYEIAGGCTRQGNKKARADIR